jgi:hypothetical protein
LSINTVQAEQHTAAMLLLQQHGSGLYFNGCGHLQQKASTAVAAVLLSKLRAAVTSAMQHLRREPVQLVAFPLATQTG